MIVPVSGEAEWLQRLRDVPAWSQPDAPTVVIAPHPDDETLCVGGLIAARRARGCKVTVVAVTDGEHAYTDNRGLAAIRRDEQTRALARLGVAPHEIVRLGLIDSGLANQEEILIERLIGLIQPGAQVFAPWLGDFHPDHQACARAAEIAAHRQGATLLSYFFWTWHCGTPASLDGLALQCFGLSPEAMRAKCEALACHASQLTHAPETEILPENLLWPARLPFEVFAL